MKQKKLLTMLVLLLMAATGAMAQTETLLTTITATAKEQASYSTANVATVSFSYLPDCYSVYSDSWGWWGYGFTATVTAAEGYTITKCVFYDNDGASATDSTDPFIVETEEENKKPKVNGATFGAFTSAGIKMIEVYGYVTPTTVDVTLAAGTEDATSWQGKAGEGEYQALPLTGLEAGTAVSVKYNGTKKVKSVTAVKKAAATPLDNTTTAWTAGTFAVPTGGLTYSDAITVSGNVTLTLTEGTTLTLNKGISLASGATLTVQGNGAMVVNGTSNSTASTVAGSTGTLILTSGTLTATGGKGEDKTDSEQTGASGGAAINGSVTVNGGSLTANGGNGGNCNGNAMEWTYGGAGGAAISGDVTITDGAVAATGGNGGSITDYRGAYSVQGGAGGAAIGGNATLTGGTLTTKEGANGTQTGRLISSSVGTGGKAVAGTVTNNGGTVK